MIYLRARWPVSFALLALSVMSVSAVELPWEAHGPLKVADHGRALVHADNTPFLWLADTAWALHQNVSREDVTDYLDDAKASGFTVIQLFCANRWALDHFKNFYGATPYLNENPATINPAYWSHLRWVIEQAGKRGLYIYLVYGSPGRKDEGMPFCKTAQEAYDYGHGVGAALRGLPNVLWAGGMDNHPTEEHRLAPMGFEGWHAMAEGINDGVGDTHGYDKQSNYDHTLMTYHVNGQNSSVSYFHDAPWLDFNMGQLGMQAGRDDHAALLRMTFAAVQKSPTKPFYSLEPWYENNTWRQTPVDDHEIRVQAYQSLLAGAAGWAYGNRNMWGMSRPRSADRNAWKKALVDPGRLQMRHVHTFLATYPQPKLPDFDHDFIVAAPEDLHKTLHLETRVSGALTPCRTLGFVYTPEAKAFTINLGALRGNRAKAAWFSTKSGRFICAEIASQGQVEMTPPFQGTDWVLVVETSYAYTRPNPVIVPYEKEWRTWDFPYFHISVGKVLMWEHTSLAKPEEQQKTQAATTRIKERGIAPLFQMAWDPVKSDEPGQREWCAWKQARPHYFQRDRKGQLAREEYSRDTISAIMPYAEEDWPAGVTGGTRNDWDLEKLVGFARATGAIGYFAADKYDLGCAHFQHTRDCDFNPRIIKAFAEYLGVTIPGDTVTQQSDYIRQHHYIAWTDYVCEGIATRHTSLQPRLEALGVKHPLVAFQVDYPIAYHRVKGLDYRMLAERADWGEIVKRVELQGDRLRDLLPKAQACSDFGLFACLAPDMMFGAQMNADHGEFWNSLNRVWQGGDEDKKDFGRKYLKQHWLAVGWWHIANSDGTVRRGVCEFMRRYWDGGRSPEKAVALVRHHVPTRPLGPALYYSRPVELVYERDYPATSRLYALGQQAYAAQQKGVPIGYSVSDIALDGLLDNPDNRPTAWLTVDTDKLTGPELRRLQRMAPIYDLKTAKPEDIPTFVRFSGGASGYAFLDQNDQVVILIWRQGRPPNSKNEAEHGNTAMDCTVTFTGMPDGDFHAKDLFDQRTAQSLKIADGQGRFTFRLDRWDCRAFICDIKKSE